jgi:ParB/RepB/Spo0J family partition protein
MPTKIEGAQRTDAFRFAPAEAKALRVSDNLCRWGGLDAAHVERLARDIAARGQLQPVIVRKTSDGLPELIGGRHRHAAILLLNEDPARFNLPGPVDLLAIYRQMTDAEAVAASVAENGSKPLSPVDMAATIGRLRNLGWENGRIAELLHITAARASQLFGLLALPDAVLRQVHGGEIPEAAARAMLKLHLPAAEAMAAGVALAKREIRAGDLLRRAAARRREGGKAVKRTLADLRTFLGGLDTAASADLLSWLDGEPTVTDEVIAAHLADGAAS